MKPITTAMPIIKHLVIAGGAHLGFSYYGALKTLVQKDIICLSNIESIYTTSVGSIVAVIFLLKYDWNIIDKYLIDRPWAKLFKIDFTTIFNSLARGGLYDVSTMQDVISPLLLGKDISIDVTLKEFYEYSNVELHFISTKFQNLDLCDISHITHPEWRLVDAIYATSCLPIIFIPFETKDGDIYIDGAINMNYAIDQSLNDGRSKDNLLGINYNHIEDSTVPINKHGEKNSFRLLFFLLDLLLKLLCRIKVPLSEDSLSIIYQVHIEYQMNNTNDEILQAIKSKDTRKQLIDIGILSATNFIDTIVKTKNNESP
jgi:predicted acylesterase/phospholipase RssA